MQTEKVEHQKMKRGITLIEIILAIILIAIILGLTIPKLMSNSDRAEVKSTISSDVKAIVEACAMWRKQSTNANGNYQNLSVGQIYASLPRSMQVDAQNGIIFSSGMKTGNKAKGDGTEDPTGTYQATAVFYTVRWQWDSTKVDSGRFSIGMSIKPGKDSLDWDDKLQTYALETFRDVIAELSDDQFTQYSTADIKTRDAAGTGDTALDFKCNTTPLEVACHGDIMIN